VGKLLSKVDPRWLIGVGLTLLSFSLFHMAHTLNSSIDFSTLVWLRIYQSTGLAFLFIPINVLAYAGVPQEKNNQVSGLVNIARNLGGSVGIAFVATWIALLLSRQIISPISALLVAVSAWRARKMEISYEED